MCDDSEDEDYEPIGQALVEPEDGALVEEDLLSTECDLKCPHCSGPLEKEIAFMESHCNHSSGHPDLDGDDTAGIESGDVHYVCYAEPPAHKFKPTEYCNTCKKLSMIQLFMSVYVEAFSFTIIR